MSPPRGSLRSFPLPRPLCLLPRRRRYRLLSRLPIDSPSSTVTRGQRSSPVGRHSPTVLWSTAFPRRRDSSPPRRLLCFRSFAAASAFDSSSSTAFPPVDGPSPSTVTRGRRSSPVDRHSPANDPSPSTVTRIDSHSPPRGPSPVNSIPSPSRHVTSTGSSCFLSFARGLCVCSLAVRHSLPPAYGPRMSTVLTCRSSRLSTSSPVDRHSPAFPPVTARLSTISRRPMVLACRPSRLSTVTCRHSPQRSSPSTVTRRQHSLRPSWRLLAIPLPVLALPRHTSTPLPFWQFVAMLLSPPSSTCLRPGIPGLPRASPTPPNHPPGTLPVVAAGRHGRRRRRDNVSRLRGRLGAKTEM